MKLSLLFITMIFFGIRLLYIQRIKSDGGYSTIIKLIFAACTFFYNLFGFSLMGYSALKNDQHNKLCDIFKVKFGYLPKNITLAHAGGIFLSLQKDFYFIFSLTFKKHSFAVRNMNPDHYDFIRKLPDEHTSWLKVKFTLFLITIVIFLATIITSFILS